MGYQTTVPYHRTPLFRQISDCPAARPLTLDGCPQRALTAYCMAVSGINDLNPVLVRQPETWQPPRTGDIGELVHDFVRHTLVRYPVPAFMYKVWQSDNTLHKQWFIHLGAGKNLRKAEGLPFSKPMTKMHAHHFCAAPAWMTITQALRYGQVRSMEGSIRMAKTIATSRIGQFIEPESEPFWLAAIREMVKAPELPSTKLRQVVEHWYQLFFVPQFTPSDTGRTKQVIPCDRLNPLNRDCLPDILERLLPNPAFIGLSSKEIKMAEAPFPKMNESWKRKLSGVPVLANYEIRQLRTSAQLLEEGRKMNHCVGTYTWHCSKGRSFIFAFRNTQRPFHQTCLTVEVNSRMRIVQIKGPSNRLPAPDEKKAIIAWAKLANLNTKCWDLE